MNILFVHHNMPGQFGRLASRLAKDQANRVLFLTLPRPIEIPGVSKIEYRLAIPRDAKTHPFAQNLQNGIFHAESAALAMLSFQKHHRIRPDIIYAHPGWGETLFLRDVFPNVPIIHYCEFYYHALGADIFFNPDEKISPKEMMKLTTKNAVNLLSLDLCDLAVTPTRWQWRLHPKDYQSKIRIIHDGIDTAQASPQPGVHITLPGGRSLSAADEVVTYVNRNLEPCRGIYSFMEAAEIIAQARPHCQFLVVGAEDGQYYEQAPPRGQTYRELALQRVRIARDRLHFLGRLQHSEYLKVLQISSAHVYLSTPFVLSWSMLEAMSVGCVVVGSNTPPVAEVITDGKNGLLADFFSADEIAERVIEALSQPKAMAEVRAAARNTVLERYASELCLAQQHDLIGEALKLRAAPLQQLTA